MKHLLLPGELFESISLSIGEAGVPSPLVSGNDPFSVLVGTVISLRTRDAVTETVTKRVLAAVPTVVDLAAISVDDFATLLYPAGFYRKKAVQLKKTAEILLSSYGGKVPDERSHLEKLPGVGGKTAAYVLSMAFGIPAICVDVHVHRISNRLGIVNTDSPEGTEKALMSYFPREMWIPLNHLFVRFGQRICLPRNPLCANCSLRERCSYAD